MKIFSQCFIFFYFVLQMLVCNAQESSTYIANPMQTIQPNNTTIRYDGRFLIDKESAKFLYPGSTISLEFTGALITAKFNNALAYYYVTIDNEAPVRLCTAENPIFQRSNLSNEKHKITITLISEGIFRNPEFYGLVVDENATIARPTDKKIRFEFIGNSITCGYGTEVTDRSPYNDSTSNFCHGFAYRTAQAFEADFMTVARSGIGIYRNYGDKDYATAYGCMPDNYEKLWLDSPHKWDFSKFTPDVLFINLGTNDTWEMSSFNADAYEKNYRKLMKTILSHYPNVKIVLLTGSMMGPEALNAVKPILDKIQTDFTTETHPVYRFDMTPSMGLGADWHPCSAQQEAMSKELIEFLKKSVIQ